MDRAGAWSVAGTRLFVIRRRSRVTGGSGFGSGSWPETCEAGAGQYSSITLKTGSVGPSTTRGQRPANISVPRGPFSVTPACNWQAFVTWLSFHLDGERVRSTHVVLGPGPLKVAHLVGSLAGLTALVGGSVWLGRAHAAGQKPFSILMPLTGGVIGILVAVLGTTAADRNFGIDQPGLLVVGMVVGASLGFLAGAALSRDYYKRASKDKS